MRMRALILAVLAAILLIAPASPQDKVNRPRKDKAEESARKVKELQKERIATLKQMADVLSRNGRVEVVEARLLVHQAELDAAEKESDRITLYKDIVDELKKLETIADSRYKRAVGPLSDVLMAKSRRLEAEINWERAKAKEAQGAK